MTSRIELTEIAVHPLHEPYLKEWRDAAIQRADDGDVAASICHQATLIDLALYKKPRHDWLGIMDEFLADDGVPIAYSPAFGARLHKFDNQSRQASIHAIHTRWWLELLNQPTAIDHARFASLVLDKKQSDGLFYDRDISETILRHRMKSEVTLSMAMSVEILHAAGQLAEPLSTELATNITSATKCPALGYMSMEYFRLRALQTLGHENLFPVGVDAQITACAEDLPFGWGDFSIRSKIDAYMGTAKRTRRDKPIHSPLIACHVAALLPRVEDVGHRAEHLRRLNAYACHLRQNPLDIPAFQMRDVPIRFGADITPIEAICASFLASQCVTP